MGTGRTARLAGMLTLIYSKHEVREARSPKIEIVKLSFGPTHRLAKKLEGNVLLEPAAATNQMLGFELVH